MLHTTRSTAIDRLVQHLSRLPGIGRRSAERLAFHLVKLPAEDVGELAHALTELKQAVHQCSSCFNLADTDPCAVCNDTRRDRSTILVVEQPNEVAALETAGLYRGVYHVLMGRLAPLEGVGPAELTADALIHRVQTEQPREVILGTSPTIEGDGTALYLAKQLAATGVKVTRLARGLPTGSSVERVSKAVLSDAIEGRQAV